MRGNAARYYVRIIKNQRVDYCRGGGVYRPFPSTILLVDTIFVYVTYYEAQKTIPRRFAKICREIRRLTAK